MQTVINKLGLFPEWSNFFEANQNLARNEDSFVKTLDLIKSFEGSNQNMYEFPNLPIITNQIQEISNVMDNANQTISCESSDLKNLESIYSKFQPKKLDKIRFDNSYKMYLKKSDQILKMIESNQFNITNLEENDEQKSEANPKQEKFDQEFEEYQKIFLQNLSNIISEFASTKMRTATKVAEIGSILFGKSSPIGIIHEENMDEMNQEIKKLKKVVKNNNKILNNENKVELCDDDDEFVIVQDKKGVIELSDAEYYEYDDEEEKNECNDTKEQKPQPKSQNTISSNDANINNLAKMLFDDDETNSNNDSINMHQSENLNGNSNAQEDIKIIASNFLIPETDEKTETSQGSSNPTNNTQQTKQKVRRHRRGKKGKH